jgi:HAD superfamily hydrolase (TIGR01490 family)
MTQNESQRHPSHMSIFDLDRTITRSGTWSPFLLCVARSVAPWRLALTPAILLAMGAYKLGLLSRAQLKSFMHRAIIGRRVRETTLTELASQFSDRQLRNGIYPQALKLIAEEKSAGRDVIIATASHIFYAEILAERCGAHSIIATKSGRDGEWLLNEIAGENCYGAAKLSMIKDYFRDHNLDRVNTHVRFYSDDLSDLPTFEWVDEPIAVNPSRKLLWHAMRSGWTILDWRRGVRAIEASALITPAPIPPLTSAAR